MSQRGDPVGIGSPIVFHTAQKRGSLLAGARILNSLAARSWQANLPCPETHSRYNQLSGSQLADLSPPGPIPTIVTRATVSRVERLSWGDVRRDQDPHVERLTPPMDRPAKLALEDGTVYTGTAFGADAEVDGEVVFNTSMTGYQEILTDPSYRGQIVTMTYPQIGNYGVNPEDLESAKVHLSGFVVRENSRIASNYRSQGTLDDFLARAGSSDWLASTLGRWCGEFALAAR